MDYYTVKNIMDLTGCGKSYSYEIIKKLINEFLKEYPDSIVIPGKIPKWYFEKKMRNKE